MDLHLEPHYPPITVKLEDGSEIRLYEVGLETGNANHILFLVSDRNIIPHLKIVEIEQRPILGDDDFLEQDLYRVLVNLKGHPITKLNTRLFELGSWGAMDWRGTNGEKVILEHQH